MSTPSEDANRKRDEEAKANAAQAAKQRAVEEAQELKAKADRLAGFINGPGYYGVSDHQKGLLRSQLAHMQSYLQVLQQRLKDWEF